MSHKATNWAIEQRGLKPATKIVLWHLCDRHHPDNGCFPSQETLADDCEMSRSAINIHLDMLEAAGLIAREQRRQKGSQRQERTRYFFAFEPGFAPTSSPEPSPENGHGSEAEAESIKSAEPCPENGESRVRNLDSNPVREPLKEPVIERERASEGSEGKIGDEDRPGTAAFQKRVQRLIHGGGYAEGEWPNWDSSSPGWIEKMFARLSIGERRDAEAGRDAMLAKARRNGKSPMLIGIYLRDKAWTLLSDADRKWSSELAARRESGKAGPPKPEGWAPAYGPAHAAELFRILIDGPQNAALAPKGGVWLANQIRSAWPRLFAFRQATALRGGLELSGGGAELMEFVPADSEAMAAWQCEIRERGWPDMAVPEGMRGLYMPKGGPDRLEEFERRVRGDADAA
jgi:hypothetical protein